MKIDYDFNVKVKNYIAKFLDSPKKPKPQNDHYVDKQNV